MKTGRGFRRAFCLMLLVFAVSCSLSSPGGGSPSPTTTTPTIVAGTRCLGYGYDVTHNYADPSEIMGQVLDFDKMQADGLIEQIQVEKTTNGVVSGRTLDQYLSSLSGNASLGGSYAGFSGSAKANFDLSRYTCSAYQFATLQILTQKYTSRIKGGTTIDTIRRYLTSAASQALNGASISPTTIFQAYGTHVLQGIVIGGRLDYSDASLQTTTTDVDKFGLDVEAAYEGTFTAKLGVALLSDTETTAFAAASSFILHAYGGKSEYSTAIFNGGDYTAWVNSIQDNPVFCDFDQNNALIPIWELCNSWDTTTGTASGNALVLKNGFDSYQQASQIDQSPLPPSNNHNQSIYNLKLYVSQSDFSGALPAADVTGGSWQRLSYDLNAGASGDGTANRIYLLIEFGPSSNPNPITDLKIIDTTNGDSAPSDYQSVAVLGGGDGNLNGNGTKWNGVLGGGLGANNPHNLYLYYGTRSAYAPLTGIGETDQYTDGSTHGCYTFSVQGASAVLQPDQPTSKFAKIYKDLNEGTSSYYHKTDQVYLWVSTAQDLQ